MRAIQVTLMGLSRTLIGIPLLVLKILMAQPDKALEFEINGRISILMAVTELARAGKGLKISKITRDARLIIYQEPSIRNDPVRNFDIRETTLIIL